MPIILTSGFGQDEVLKRFLGKGLAGFLPKPYRLQALLEAVRAALGEGVEADGAGRMPAPVAWEPEFDTGHALVDVQHRRLVARFNDLLERAREPKGNREAMEEILHDFIGATVAHFGIEEGLMADAGYAGLEAHRAVHAQLTRQIQELAQDLHRGEVGFTPPILNFLEGWLLCHIQYEDRELAQHLKVEVST
jgi:hemerythrin